MQTFDLAIAYKWKYDLELVREIEIEFQNSGLSTYVIHKDIIQQITNMVLNKEIFFRAFLDRATDEDDEFEPLAEAIIASGSKIINHHHLIEEAIDKAEIFPYLVEAGIKIPETIIIQPLDDEPNLTISTEDLQKLGIPFVVKPAYYTGGGEGVNVNAESLDDIQKVRREFSDDRILLQKKIETKFIDGYKAWFRAFFLFDQVFVVQWDDSTKLYDNIIERNLSGVNYEFIKNTTKKIADICGLNYFSTEFAISNDDIYYTIDFVNDPCDFRKQSLHADGVPDEIVQIFINKMKEFVKN